MFACPGQENTDGRCSVGDAKNMFLANIDCKHPPDSSILPTLREQIDHNGPYNGMRMDC